jgi:TonB family protein
MLLSKHAFVTLVALLLVPCLLYSQAAEGPLRVAAPPTRTYENSTEGLQLLLQDVLAAARVGDRPKLASLVNQMEIPNYQEWFTKTFGKEKGESWVESYGRDLTRNESVLQDMFMQFANQDEEIITRKVNDAPEPGRDVEFAILNNQLRPVDIYYASWRKRESPKGSNGDPIGYFVFVDGKFRWDSSIRFMTIRPSIAPNDAASPWTPPARTASQPSDLPTAGNDHGAYHPGVAGVGYPSCVYCPDPQYTKQARKKRLQGTVTLQAIIQADGRATDIQVLKSSVPDLNESAIEAVGRWRFKPALRADDQPVPVTVPIEITFRMLF